MFFNIKNKNKPIFLNDYRVFDYFPKNVCNHFSSFNNSDLTDFLQVVNSFFLEYLDAINLDPKNTFGIEIEFEDVLAKNNMRYLREALSKGFINLWDAKYDITLSKGSEIVSPPLIDQSQTWIELKNVCDIIKPTGVSSPRTGGHIHYGKQIIGENPKNWFNLLKLWAAYEKVIFRFAYGEYLTHRSSVPRYARPVAKNMVQMINSQEELSLNDVFNSFHKVFGEIKATSISFDHLIPEMQELFLNTIEIRIPNGTIDPIIWQNNINFFGKLLQFASSTKFNDEVINERIRKENPENYDLDSYNQIYLESALELADLIFDNNLDKIYFLRQYLKNFELYKKSTNPMGSSFVKVA